MRAPSTSAIARIKLCALVLTMACFAAFAWFTVDWLNVSAETHGRKTRVRLNLYALEFQPWNGATLPRAVRSDATGRQLLSWRFEVYLASRNFPVAPSLDHAWDDPANRYFAEMSPFEYCLESPRGKVAAPETCIFAVTGPGTPFDEVSGAENKHVEKLDGDTILLIEVRDSNTHWMAPGDFDITDLRTKTPREAGFGSSVGRQDGFVIGFADGQVVLLSYDVPMSTLLPFMALDATQRRSRDDDLGPFVLRW